MHSPLHFASPKKDKIQKGDKIKYPSIYYIYWNLQLILKTKQ